MLREHVHRAGITVVHATTVTAIHAGGGGPEVPGGSVPGRRGVPARQGAPGGEVVLRGNDRHGEAWSAECDGIVLVTQRASEDSLHAELTADPAVLAAAGIRLLRIGDVVAPRMISEAIFDGHRLGREIDRPDPAAPAPYLRESAGLA